MLNAEIRKDPSPNFQLTSLFEVYMGFQNCSQMVQKNYKWALAHKCSFQLTAKQPHYSTMEDIKD